MFELVNLAFNETDLEPIISKMTLEFHYKKHHKAYIDKVNELIKGTNFENMSLDEIILNSFNKPELLALYNNAGQVFNHNVYWDSVKIGERLDDDIKDKFVRDFGSIDSLKQKLVDESMKVFGSGWVWLVKNKDGKYEVISTKNGDTPLILGLEPVFNIDVWEHAYYIDYQNRRKDYVEGFLSLLKL